MCFSPSFFSKFKRSAQQPILKSTEIFIQATINEQNSKKDVFKLYFRSHDSSIGAFANCSHYFGK